ncbi:MAG: PA14 domain-containing protein [Phycisphaerales bacterium]|jgi:hypothetical protein|nr:PA14 domain-containing protein [Phycisphaerales bacterium]
MAGGKFIVAGVLLAFGGVACGGDPVTVNPVGPLPGAPGSGLQGVIFSAAVNSLDQALTAIQTGVPAGGVTGATINYGNSSVSTPLSTWLGTDAPSLTGLPGTTPASGLIFNFGGFIAISTPGTYAFIVTSDDGMRLNIGGVTVTSFPGDRSFSPSTGSVTFSGAGVYPIELLYWANTSGESGLRLEWTVPGSAPAVVPQSVLYLVPSPGATALLAFGGVMVGRRRRSR